MAVTAALVLELLAAPVRSGGLSPSLMVWSDVAVGSIAARSGTVTAYDPATAQEVLFGGLVTASRDNDTWTWGASGWTQVNTGSPGCTTACPASPSGRSGAVMAYDPATAQLVLFGGTTASGLVNDTWTWSGSAWTQVNTGSPGCTSACPASPSPRAGAVVAYDQASAQLVLFGGYDGSGYDNDTWTWGGTGWTQVNTGSLGCTNACPASPPGRTGAAGTYDEATAQLVVFGGYDGTNDDNDTWVWSGTAWAQVDDSGNVGCLTTCPTSPHGRQGATVAFDARLAQPLLIAGTNGTSYYDDTWTWNGSSWTQDDVNSSACTTACSNSPTGRTAASLFYDPGSGQLVIYGGLNAGGSLSGAFNFIAPSPTAAEWAQVNTASAPTGRGVGQFAYDEATSQMVLFGGIGPGPTDDNDTWTWSGSSWTQVDDAGAPGCTTTCPGSPAGRYSGAMAYDPATGQLLLFGGSTAGATPWNDTWLWNGSTWTQVNTGSAGCTNACPNSPPARQGGQMAYDPATGQLVLFGGALNPSYYNDTWTWNGSSWTQADDAGAPGCTTTCPSSPPGRQAGAMADDPATAQLVYFGGGASAGNFNDTWLWNGSSWSQTDDAGSPGCTTTCPTSPAPRIRPGMAFDPATAQLIVYGGGSTYGDTWFWGGSTWTQCNPSTTCYNSPAARSGPNTAFDPATGQLVVFSGSPASGPSTTDTWVFDFSPLALTPAAVTWSTTLNGFDASLGQAVTVEVANEGTLGWDLAVSSSEAPYSATLHLSLASTTINGSAGSASSSAAPVPTCPATCRAPSGNTATYPVTVPIGSASDLYNAAAGTGIGNINLATDWWEAIPANTLASSYANTVTLTLSYGP
ncbi:MAG TPA: hypothetical protein VKG43_01430 [Acidimicrobiales bacterium]|nr:hypothetical protein [Acidimicrobiales bacterium]